MATKSSVTQIVNPKSVAGLVTMVGRVEDALPVLEALPNGACTQEDVYEYEVARDAVRNEVRRCLATIRDGLRGPWIASRVVRRGARRLEAIVTSENAETFLTLTDTWLGYPPHRHAGFTAKLVMPTDSAILRGIGAAARELADGVNVRCVFSDRAGPPILGLPGASPTWPTTRTRFVPVWGCELLLLDVQDLGNGHESFVMARAVVCEARHVHVTAEDPFVGLAEASLLEELGRGVIELSALVAEPYAVFTKWVHFSPCPLGQGDDLKIAA